MRILVVGSAVGGSTRSAWAISGLARCCDTLYCAPGNAGIAAGRPSAWRSAPSDVDDACSGLLPATKAIDYVVVGPGGAAGRGPGRPT